MRIELDWISIIALLLIILSAVVAVTYYYNMQNQECISNPLVYGAKKFSDETGFDFYGSGYFLMKGSPIVNFNAINMSISYP